MTDRIHVSPSSLSKQLACGQAARYEYVLGLVPLVTDQRWRMGKAVHALLESVLLIHAEAPTEACALALANLEGIAREAFGRLINEDHVTLPEEEGQEAVAIVRARLPHMGLEHFRTVRVDGKPAVELDLTCELTEGVDLRCRIDWIAEHVHTNDVYVIDHKTMATVTSNAVEHDRQLALYRYACAQNHIRTDGAMHHRICSHAPKPPRVLKGDRLSVAKDQRTMWSMYEAALRERHLNPDDYGELREHLEARLWGGYFLDVSSEASQTETLSQAILAAIQRRDGVLFPNRGRACLGCRFKSWCDAEYDDLDPRALIDTHYQLAPGSPLHAIFSTNTEPPDAETLARADRRASGLGEFAAGQFHPETTP